ncbi:SCO family protein [Halobacillus karajensis]|uniref:BsSco n=1 Tax=Halobacillus karajensis TaxID=195088 RepID=A0A024P290_9BACI|nr:SCO family protein [Halobacillus karajensis]CDQ19934.1 BsSco [Halobacillus karajensis]CDQ22394.1 BsSco [Halobacillus karajensis]CDQ28237.1 BsSco [Halobacillus karajensis]
MKMKFGFSLLLILLISAGCGSKDVEELSAINQHGEQVSVPKEYAGDYWVADFIFTNCETVCPPMTGNMSRLQAQLQEEGLDIQLVSVSVDPENDTQDKLLAFAENYQPDFEHWDFLTGYSYQDVKEWSIKSFQSPVKKMEDSNQVAHGTSFFLVGPDGNIQETYSGTKADSVTKIVEDLKKLKE